MFKTKILGVIASLSLTAAAQSDMGTDEPVIISSTQGIVLVGGAGMVKKEGVSTTGVQVVGIDLPGPLEDLEKLLKNSFLGRPLTKDSMMELKKTIILFYREHNRPIVQVQIPEQEVTGGVIQLVVYEGKMGRVFVKGNRYFKSSRLEQSIRLEQGRPIDNQRLLQDLTWINRNPFIKADAVFRPGQEKETTDIDLIVKDRWPYRLYGGIDNTGLKTTGHNRYYSGINFGNLWNIGHQANYQFITSSTYKEFWAHSGQYVIPLPWRHLFQVFGGYSSISADLKMRGTPGFHTHGQSIQTSLRYEAPLWNRVDFLQEVSCGFDWKRTNNNLTFFGTPFFGQAVNIGQIMLGYNNSYERDNWKCTSTMEAFWMPGPCGMGDQSGADFNALRKYAPNHYFYFRGSVLPIVRFSRHGFYLHQNLRGQWANANLLSSEQFGIGGYNTVRGYPERALNGDSAALYNIELRSPHLHLLRHRKKPLDSLQLLVFYDWGMAFIHKPTKGEQASQFITGIGPGLRYYIDPYVTVRVDYGYRLKKLEAQPNQNHKWHFGVVASY